MDSDGLSWNVVVVGMLIVRLPFFLNEVNHHLKAPVFKYVYWILNEIGRGRLRIKVFPMKFNLSEQLSFTQFVQRTGKCVESHQPKWSSKQSGRDSWINYLCSRWNGLYTRPGKKSLLQYVAFNWNVDWKFNLLSNIRKFFCGCAFEDEQLKTYANAISVKSFRRIGFWPSLESNRFGSALRQYCGFVEYTNQKFFFRRKGKYKLFRVYTTEYTTQVNNSVSLRTSDLKFSKNRVIHLISNSSIT